ncbi:MAG: NifU family protein [Nitrospirae bacterium]|nr:NifU family protein [Nitrospirota bacterium]
MLDKVQAAIEKIRPALQMDGGDVELVAVEEGGVVKIRLQGACTVCPSIGMTLQYAIEKSIKENIPEVTRVVNLEPRAENHA